MSAHLAPPARSSIQRRALRGVLPLAAAAAALLALLLAMNLAPTPAHAAARARLAAEAGTMRLLPETETIAPGETVEVVVWLEDVADYYSLDLRVEFDPDIVDVPAGQATPLWDVFHRQHNFLIKNQVDAQEGRVWYALTNISPAESFTGTGRVCRITFRGLTTGTTPLDILYAKGRSPSGTDLFPARVDGQITVVGDDTNAPPTADAGGPYGGTRNEMVTLDGTGSFDLDGSVETYAWSVDGTPLYEGPVPTYTLDLAGYGLGERGVALTVTDDLGASGGDTTSLTVSNAPPVALDDHAATPMNTSVAVDVTTNDYDPDGVIDPGTLTLLYSPNSGTVQLGAQSGVVTYTPDLGVTGTDVFTYTVEDNDAAPSNPATVLIAIGEENQPPVAVPDTTETSQDTPVSIDVTLNDYDPDGELDLETVAMVGAPSDGSVTVGTGGVITYVPNGGFSGSDSFSYTVDDIEGSRSNEAQVTVTVNPQPLISGIYPPTATVGSPAFTLTVYGSHFLAESALHWDGQPRTTTYVNQTQLRAFIPTDDLAEAAVRSVTVVNPETKGGLSNIVPFEVAESNPAPGPSMDHVTFLPFVSRAAVTPP
jgi:hypothetical protein